MALHKETLWFSSGVGVVGIVLAVHEKNDDHGDEGEPCAYVGAGSGQDEEGDIQLIMEYGAYFSKAQMVQLCQHYGIEIRGLKGFT